MCEWRWKAFLYKICGGDRRERTIRGHQGIRIHVAHSPQATARQAGQIWPCCWDSGHRCRVRFQHVAKTRGAFPCQQAFGMQCRPPHHRNPGSSRRWGPGAHAMARQGGCLACCGVSGVGVPRAAAVCMCRADYYGAGAARNTIDRTGYCCCQYTYMHCTYVRISIVRREDDRSTGNFPTAIVHHHWMEPGGKGGRGDSKGVCGPKMCLAARQRQS